MPAGATRRHRAGHGRQRVDRLEDLRVDLAEHAGIGDGDGQHAGGRPQAHGADEQQRPDDFRKLRKTISSPRTGQRSVCAHQAGRPPRLSAESDSARVASSAQGMATARAKVMPAVAMARVSSVACQSRARNSPPCSGGQKPARNAAMVSALLPSNSTPRSSSLRPRPGHSSATASNVSSRREVAAGSRWTRAGFSIVECSAAARAPVVPARVRAARWHTAQRVRQG
ncbi:hypothetical protein BAY1663_02398 [Pseudomonas sp. BAY1663]|nr:hypothetical protein BAY1663_02398 [Pseudomonas sp. BAY1663]